MFRWISDLFGEGEEVRQLREEVAALKAAREPLLASGPGAGPPPVNLGAAKEQLAHFKAWVYAAVRPTAQRIAGQSVRVGRKAQRRAGRKAFPELAPAWVKALPDDVEVVERHPLLDALADPNPIMVPWSLMFSTTAALELTGLSYWWLTQGEDGRLQVWPLPPSWVAPVRQGASFDAYEVRPPGAVEPFVLPADDVVRFAYPDPADPFGAVSPLRTLAAAVNCDEAMQRAQQRAFSQGIWPGVGVRLARNAGVNGVPGNRPVLNEYQRAQILNAVKLAWRGINNFGEPVILDGLIEDVFPLTKSPQEMAFLDSSKLTKQRIFQGFGVNPLIAGEIEGANRAQAVVAEELFLSGTINPKIELLSQCLTGWFSWRYSDPSLLVWVESARPRDEEAERARFGVAVKAGAVRINEVREFAGLPPLEKGGDALVTIQSANKGARKRRRRQEPGSRIVLPGSNGHIE